MTKEDKQRLVEYIVVDKSVHAIADFTNLLMQERDEVFKKKLEPYEDVLWNADKVISALINDKGIQLGPVAMSAIEVLQQNIGMLINKNEESEVITTFKED